MSETQLLRIVDCLLSISTNRRGRFDAQPLEQVLLSAGSKWMVGTRLGKTRACSEGPGSKMHPRELLKVLEQPERSCAARGPMSTGLEPNDSAAYADAVRAAEIAGIGVIQPQHATAPLGTVLGQMLSDGDWRLPLREHQDAPGVNLVLDMIRSLWHRHRDRHGSVNYSDVGHDEARAAVMLAVTLVHWFTSGALQSRP
jgi:hypothetical protein